MAENSPLNEFREAFFALGVNTCFCAVQGVFISSSCRELFLVERSGDFKS